jgi:UDP-N-acetylmuramyl pentapeptide phosphotransferase/UDP-N-acetylglucosamine-1-phosphate transferase
MLSHISCLTGGIVCLITSTLIVLSKDWHGHLTLDNDYGIQKVHTQPTPRVGGIGIMLGLLAAIIVSEESIAKILTPITIAAIPAFLFGFIEDLTKKVSIKTRLLATMSSGILAWYLTGISLTKLNIPLIDDILQQWLPISIIITALAVGGIANSINIIDGFNGLASGTVAICLISFGFLANTVGDLALSQTCFILVAITLGFLVINFPFGKVFLGDGGAYSLGFLLAWIAILLPMRNPQISSWASLVICSYPVIEVVFSVLRRYRRNHHPGHPDRLHLHSLIKTRIVRQRFPKLTKTLRNAAVSPIIWGYLSLSQGLAIIFKEDTGALVLVFLICILAYELLYMRLISFRWKWILKRKEK